MIYRIPYTHDIYYDIAMIYADSQYQDGYLMISISLAMVFWGIF